MKTFTLITIIVILFSPLQILAQIENKSELFADRLLKEGINSITQPDEQIRQRFQSDNFDDSESRTTINKKLLDNGFLLIEEYWQNWNGYNWANNVKFSYIYDVNNNKIERLLQDWSDSIWVNGVKETYTYDSNNNMIEELWQGWLVSEMIWVNTNLWNYTYDANNNKIEKLWQHWDGSNWINNDMFTYVYDANNNKIEELLQNWDGFNWLNIIRVNYIYDSNNNMIEVLWQSWNGSNWMNTNLWSCTYDGNNMINRLTQEWNGSNWVNDENDSYTYDANSNMIEWLSQDWDGSNWVNGYKTSYNFDASNNLIEVFGQEWDGSNWVNIYRYIYSYLPTDVKEFNGEVNNYSLSNNFPNPFNPSTTIRYEIPEQSFVTIKVYDILGNEIATLVNEEKPAGSYEVEFNIYSDVGQNLVSGVYFYKLQTGNFVQTKKMILLK